MDKRPDYAFNIKAFLTYHFLQYGQTPVYVASCKGHVTVVELLMKNGADIRICKEAYNFPLNYSIVDVSVDSIAINM